MKIIKYIKKQFKMHPGLKFSMITLWLTVFIAFIGFIVFTFHNRKPLELALIALLTLALFLLSLLATIAFEWLKKLPSGLVFFLLSSLVMLTIMISSSKTEIGNYILIASLLVCLSTLGYLLYILYIKLDQRKVFFKWYQIPIGLLFVVSLAVLVYVFIYEGPIDTLEANAFNTYVATEKINEIEASYTVEKGVYGMNRFLDRYGPGVESKTVSIGSFLNKWGDSREAYLGFNIYDVPLNGHYYKPKESGNYPLVLIVHGNHEMTHPSDTGYDYLGTYLAERGYFCVSVDENFLNFSTYDSKVMQEKLGSENDARGFVLYKHLEWLLDSEFKNMIDAEHIALIGHSRGGEAITSAKLYTDILYLPNNGNKRFYPDFNIETLIAIAPTDSQYKPGGRPVIPEDVNYLIIQGSHDYDVSYMLGGNTYERIQLSEGNVKASVNIYGANHGYFNENWHQGDTSPFSQYTHTLGNLMSREKQEIIAKRLVSYFLEGTMRNESYLKGFEQLKNLELPNNLYLSQFHTGRDLILADFNEDYLLETSSNKNVILNGDVLSSWYESTSRLDGKTSHVYGVYMGGNGYYEVNLIEAETGYNHLFLTLADDDADNRDLIDLKIEVIDSKGYTQTLYLSEYGFLQHYLQVHLSKFYFFEDRNTRENVFQSFELSLDPDLIDVQQIKIYMPNNSNRIIMKDMGLR